LESRRGPPNDGSATLSDLDQGPCRGFQLCFLSIVKRLVAEELRAFFNVQTEDALGQVSALVPPGGARLFAPYRAKRRP
jgi:hypothetical protein